MNNRDRQQAPAPKPPVPTPRVVGVQQGVQQGVPQAGQPAAKVQQTAQQTAPKPKVHPAMLARAPVAAPPSTAKPAAKPAVPPATGTPERLIAILERSGTLYAQLMTHAKARRAALRAGDFAGFSRLDEPEKRVVAQIADLDQQRLAEARALAAKLGLAADASLVQIAEKLPPSPGGRILILREELRTLILEVRRETSVVRQAAERLSAHIAGIVQSVHAALAHANIYSSAGQIATSGGSISSLDIRS